MVGLSLVLLSQDASAQTPPKLVLDYDTQASGCPDAERFSDEVSSKLGFVPWSSEGNRLRVRIREEDGEFVGTVELPDGNAKILRDTSCPALVGALASAVSVALDSESVAPTPQVPAQEPRQGVLPKATVHVATDAQGISVSIIKDRMMMVGSNGVSAVGISWTEVCVAPCTFELEPGGHEVMISGKGPASSRKLNVVAGGDTYLKAEAGSSGLYYGGWTVGLVGFTAFTYGLIKYLIPSGDEVITGEKESSGVPIALMVGGLAGTGLGLGMMYKSGSRLDEEAAPSQVTARAISYSGSF